MCHWPQNQFDICTLKLGNSTCRGNPVEKIFWLWGWGLYWFTITADSRYIYYSSEDISTVVQIQTGDQTARTFHAPELLPYSDSRPQSAHFSHFAEHGSSVKMEDMSTVFQEFHGGFLWWNYEYVYRIRAQHAMEWYRSMAVRSN